LENKTLGGTVTQILNIIYRKLQKEAENHE
jgi:hypothetical protein